MVNCAIPEKSNHVEFPGVLVLVLKISEGCNAQFCRVSRGEALFLSGISRGKEKTSRYDFKTSTKFWGEWYSTLISWEQPILLIGQIIGPTHCFIILKG